MLLSDISAAHINTAVQIYLDHAYEAEALRAAHAVAFPVDMAIREVLNEFETDTGTQLSSYSLRLGCQHYPHLKLCLHEAYFRDEYVLSVDRHDGFDFEKTGPDYEQWLGIKSRNHRAKMWIEEEWYKADLPTLRQLKETRLTLSAIMRAFSGHIVLLVDDDLDGGAILQMCLESAGYECLWVKGVTEANALLTEPGRSETIGLLIVDLMLGDGSGHEVVQAVRTRAATQNIPIILTSAMNETDVQQIAVDVYLRKPFAIETLTETVGKTLQRRYDDSDRLMSEDK